MSYDVKKTETIIDYLEVLVSYKELVHEEVSIVCFNAEEWAQFTALIEANYKDVNKVINKLSTNCILYNNIVVYNSLRTKERPQYYDALAEYRHCITRIHNEVQNHNIHIGRTELVEEGA